ncbi:MAG: tetratricopeptide repeat-containing sensor histidine kinase, partial [Leeuwenhoekiella sp.]
RGLASGYNRKGTYYIMTAKYSYAIRMLLLAAPYYKKLNDSSGIAKVYGNIGALDFYLRDYKSALTYFNEAMSYVPKNDPSNNVSRFFTNFSGVYRAMKKYDTALVYAEKAIKINSDLKQNRELAISYVNRGAAQYELLDYAAALESLNIAMTFEEIPAQFKLIDKIFKARSYIALDQLDAAASELEELEEQSKGLKDEDILLDLYLTLSQYSSKIKDYERALNYKELYVDLNERLHNSEQMQIQQNLKVEFETLQKENDNKVLRHETEMQDLKIQNQRFVIGGVVVFTAILLVLLFIVYRLYTGKQKANKLLYEKQVILNENNKNLEKIDAQKNNLFSIVAHDVKSPLSVIITMVDLLKENIESFSKKELLMLTTELSVQTKGIYRLLDGVLAWARSQLDGYKFDSHPVEVREVIDVILESKLNRIKEKNISLEINVDPGHTIVSDSHVVEVVLRNFVDNAIKFTGENGVIKFSMETKNNENYISVADTGVGISEETITQIFQEGNRYTSQGTSNEAGNGIGLILSNDIVQKLGGRIEVESKPDEGSVFTLVLPEAQS